MTLSLDLKSPGEVRSSETEKRKKRASLSKRNARRRGTSATGCAEGLWAETQRARCFASSIITFGVAPIDLCKKATHNASSDKHISAQVLKDAAPIVLFGDAKHDVSSANQA